MKIDKKFIKDIVIKTLIGMGKEIVFGIINDLSKDSKEYKCPIYFIDENSNKKEGR